MTKLLNNTVVSFVAFATIVSGLALAIPANTGVQANSPARHIVHRADGGIDTYALNGQKIIDGDRVRAPELEGIEKFDVYIIKIKDDVPGEQRRFKRLVLNEKIFESYGHWGATIEESWNSVKDVHPSVLDQYETSELVRHTDENGRIVGDGKIFKLSPDPSDPIQNSGTRRHLNLDARQFECYIQVVYNDTDLNTRVFTINTAEASDDFGYTLRSPISVNDLGMTPEQFSDFEECGIGGYPCDYGYGPNCPCPVGHPGCDTPPPPPPPCDPVINLTGVTINGTTATLAWDSLDDCVDQYEVLYKKVGATGASASDIGRDPIDVTATSHTISGLDSGTQYEFVIEGRNINENDPVVTSNPVRAITGGVGLVENIQHSSTTDSIAITWDDPNNLGLTTSYKIEYKKGDTGAVTTRSTSSRSITLTGLDSNSPYEFRIAITADVIGVEGQRVEYDPTDWISSSTDRIEPDSTLLPAPRSIDSSVTSSSITISWQNVTGATGYKVEYKKVGTNSYRTRIINSPRMRVSNLEKGKEYEFKISTRNSSIDYGASRTFRVETDANIVIVPVLPNVTGLRAVSRTTDSVDLSWSRPQSTVPTHVAIYTLIGYDIRINGDDSFVDYVAGTNTLTKRVQGLTRGTQYSFEVRPVYSRSTVPGYTRTDEGAYSAPMPAITLSTDPICENNCLPLPAPKGITSFDTSESITLTWNDVTHATGYRVEYRAVGTRSFTTLPTTNTSSITVSKIVGVTEYEFKISTRNGSGDYGASRTKTVTVDAPSRGLRSSVTGLTETPSYDYVTLNWDRSQVTIRTIVMTYSLIGYDIRINSDDSRVEYVAGPNTLTKKVQGLTRGTQYTFEVRPVYSISAVPGYTRASEGSYSSPVRTQTLSVPSSRGTTTTTTPTTTTTTPQGCGDNCPLLSSPRRVDTLVTSNSITLDWQDVDDATGYRVKYRKIGTRSYTTRTMNTSSMTASNLESETRYEFKISTRNGSGDYGASRTFRIPTIRVYP